MRDPARMEPLMDLITAIWNKHPDLRLAQLILNCMNPDHPPHPMYHMEDDELAKRLREVYLNWTNPLAPS